jgi:energy-converting hydrogenase Eha subunit A
MNEIPPIMNNPSISGDGGRRANRGCFSPVVLAWLIGTFIYFASVLDGFESLILQPVIGAVVSAVSVGIVCGAGFVLRISPLGRFWSSSCWLAVGLAALGLTVLLFGKSLGMSSVYADPESQQQFIGLSPKAAISGYFALLFAVANWPSKKIKES